MNLIKTTLTFDPVFGLLFTFYSILIFLAFCLTNKMRAVAALKKKVEEQDKTILELDQQAKLIIKGDMELKLYQQEVEDKLKKLTVIKNLVISSMPVLDKEQLFSQIDKKVINSLGFKKGLILEAENLDEKANVGFGAQEIETIRNTFKYKKESLNAARLLPYTSEIYKQLQLDLKAKEILVAPVKVKEQIQAIFVVSGLIIPTKISQSEEETMLIICICLSQCLDKIGLFENVYHVKDSLEKKIKERTSELVGSLREIKLISKAKSDFISSVSHELRTPLTSVKGFSSLLVDEKFGKLPEEAKKRLAKIDENVDKLMYMINTLLDISRIESGKTELKIVHLEIVELIKDIAEFLSPQIKSKELNLVLQLPKTLNVYLDKTLIERLFINLLNNAIKFTPVKGKITIGCKKDNNNKALISVSDTGCGMKKDDSDKIFQEFFRVDDAGHKGIKGTGLGLSLVKRIIDTHKEKIWVESEVGKGTSFHFTLKLA
jgi:signal transduction histidine kinase